MWLCSSAVLTGKPVKFIMMSHGLPNALSKDVLGCVMRSVKTWRACRTASKSFQLAAADALVEYLERHLQLQEEKGRASVSAVHRWIRMLAATSGGDARGIRCFLKGLRDWRLWIQVACLHGMPRVVRHGDPMVEEALVEYIVRKGSRAATPEVQFVGSTTTREECKFEALKCLAKVGSANSRSVIAVMLDNLLFTYTEDTGREHWEERQHMPAVDGLVELGKVGDSDLIDRLLGMSHGAAVYRALAKLTNKGNAKVIQALLKVMPGFFSIEGIDYHQGTVDDAYMALQEILEPCDKPVLGALVGMISDPNICSEAFEAVDRATRENHVQGIRFDYDESGPQGF